MNIALINKETNVCENIAVFEDMETAAEMFGGDYILAEVVDGYGMGDLYDGEWSTPEPEEVQEVEPTELEQLRADVDYLLIMMEG